MYAIFFNAILNMGFYPETRTESIIIPLYKKGRTDDVNNYRSIILVSCLSKLFYTMLKK